MFVALAVVWTWPLVTDLSGQLPGLGNGGDSQQFLWNFWWMRTALASGQDVFFTSYMLAPAGASLVLHTFTPLPAFAGATVLGSLPVAAALNVTVLAGLFLNGFCAYLLCWRLSDDRAAAVLGGMIFACSSYLTGHLSGHFNLTHAWTIPLFALAALRAMRSGLIWSVLAGLVLGVTFYIDYYYLVYECGLAVLIAATTNRDWSIAWTGSGSAGRIRAARVVLSLAALVGLLVVAIIVTGGFSIDMGGRTISARGLFNPLQMFWILAACWAWLRFGPRILAARINSETRLVTKLAVMALTLFIVALPLIPSAIGLFRSGDYVTQTYFWRNAPGGIDLAALVAGPPFHGLAGPFVRDLYLAFGVGQFEEVIEENGWMGIVPVLLAAAALRRHRADPSVRQWTVIGLVFFVWALGPHLRVFGMNTAMILPQALLRYIPIVNNVRIPGRAMVVVTLGLAALASVFIARWRPSAIGRRTALAALGFFLVVESAPSPFPVVKLAAPQLYQTLRDRPEAGAVLELPLGIRDGLGGRGSFNEMQFYYQTVHGRPLVGGYLSRLPTSVVAAYASDPLLNFLLDASEPDGKITVGATLPSGRIVTDSLRANGIAFVVLDRAAAPARLTQYIEAMAWNVVATEGDRSLYVVAPASPAR